jgi:hypothetical protein
MNSYEKESHNSATQKTKITITINRNIKTRSAPQKKLQLKNNTKTNKITLH